MGKESVKNKVTTHAAKCGVCEERKQQSAFKLPVSAAASLQAPFKRATSAKLQLKSEQKQPVTLISLFFFFFCRFYTVSFIYNKNQLISYFIFYKRTTPALWVREEKTDPVRRACVPFAAASVAVRPQREIR